MSVVIQKGVPVRAGQFLVKYRSSALESSREGERLSRDIFLLEAQDARVLERLNQVEYVVPNHAYRREQALESLEPPTDQWGLHNTGQNGGRPDADVDAPEAWEQTTGKTLVAVLDTGLDTRHPDLQANLYRNPGEIPDDGLDNDGNGVVDDVHGFDAALRTGDPWSDDPHGTHCAGTIAAAGEVLGVAPSTGILPIKIYDEEEWTDAATLVRALEYAREAGARVVSHSYGGLAFNRALREALASPEMLHVVAAGNYSSNNDQVRNYPSSYRLENLISVAASDRNDRIASFSNYGKNSVHLAAPGVDILSTSSYGGHGSWSGTSMACPHVAGAAALVATKFPQESPQQWKARILSSVDQQAGWEEKVSTGGRLNAAAALG